MYKHIASMLIAVAAAPLPSAAFAQEHHEPHQLAADVNAFHAVLAPVWHAGRGKERSQDACAKTGQMEALAKDIRSTNASALQAAVATLKEKCAGKPAEIDDALHDVHEAFHRLIEARPGK